MVVRLARNYPKTAAEEEQIREELKRNLIPIFLNQHEINYFYEGFSNAILWPLCHYRPSYVELKPEYWTYYASVNHKFADLAKPYITEQTTVWVHDYQLMVLPGLIRQESSPRSIGYFHPYPFPPGRTLPDVALAAAIATRVDASRPHWISHL